jgi:CheY-like chemotaxis protein
MTGNHKIIFAVDDNAENLSAIKNTLKDLYEVYPCLSAEKMFDLLEHVRPHLILLDVEMPDMNGYEAAKKLKNSDTFGGIPIIFITSRDDEKSEIEGLSLGAVDYISKPFVAALLIQRIKMQFALDDHHQTEINTTDAHVYEDTHVSAETDNYRKIGFNFKGYTILAAEDVDINREILSAILKETGISIEFAEDGAKVVSMFSSNPDKYSLIIMDVNMPVMDGYEATQAIRALSLQQAKDICIIAMTANASNEDVKKCLQAGMNDHIEKPVSMDALNELLKKYLPHH